MKVFEFPLVNTHTHAAMVAFRGLAEDLPLENWLNNHIWPREKKEINPAFVYQNTRKAIQEMKQNGIRAFNDMYFFEDEVAKAAKEAKMKVVIGEVILDFPTPSAQNPKEALVHTEKLIKKYKNDPDIRVAVAPHSIYALAEKWLLEAKKLARKHQALFHLHLSETEDEFDNCLLKHGATPVGYLEKLGLLDEKALLAHCVWLTKEDLKLIVKRKATVLHCPLSNLKLGSGIAPVAKYLRAGAQVALGTDGAASSNRLDIWEAGKMAALLAKGTTHDPAQVSAKQAIEMMTLKGLKALEIKKIKGKTISQWQKELAKKKDFNYLYELNVNELKFS